MSNYNKYKLRIQDLLFSNQDLLKLIHYPYDNAMGMDDIENVHSLIENNIFFRLKNINFEESAKVFLIIYIDKYRGFTQTYDEIGVTFDIICHNSLWYLNNEDDRVEEISSILDGLICGSNIGIGRVKREYENMISINKAYEGKRIKYKFSDFSPNMNR